MVRLLPNGALDPSLNADGKAIIDVGTQDRAYGFVRLSSGDLAMVGTSTGQDLTLVRLDSSGSPLSGFASAGVVSLPRSKPARAFTLLERTGTLLLIGAELDGSKVHAVSASIFD